jgi:hypothetical protein
MSAHKLRVANTELDNLISNLRGEVGEIITTWILLRNFLGEIDKLKTANPLQDMQNQSLGFAMVLANKLEDELVARLSELGEAKIGRLTFYFAAVKLNNFLTNAAWFSQLVSKYGLREKRNRSIAHKELPERWDEHRHHSIPYRSLLRVTAGALIIMKRLDRIVLGPAAPYLWREGRKRRYEFMTPPSVGYMILPYLRLSGEDRVRIVVAEMHEGVKQVWSEMATTLNGSPTTILACREWGVIILGDQWLPLDQYPLLQLNAINFDNNVKPVSARAGSVVE